ncbi:hypothetical protein PA25_22210 [Pseudoalteromonas sp. A25]|uniref:DUF1203 domain-containing protein n=1 Tax=Pseudoalteromonas sp. A25 TaxID=116092 RepID=UPI0012A2BFA3|nr:DUF1203 domain-containing protein [Pseudoalteromonas sp. A25]BBN82236.1 hypothetical protein PA25_22210 [Pseudoalteromonas sp. A25]
MATDFQFIPLAMDDFIEFKALDDTELAARHAKWMIVDEEPGYPCRVSMQDAKIGERVLFLPYWHHNVDSAYKAMGTILVREFAQTAQLGINEVPQMLEHRLLSIRAYDATNMMIAHDICEGSELKLKLQVPFANPSVEYIHLHYASPGCFCCKVSRV